VGAAHREGLGRARLRAADLSAPFHGVRTTARPADVVALALAYVPLLGPTQYFSHLTAARIHGLRMPFGGPEKELHVTSVAPQRAPRAEGVVGHRAGRSSVVEVAGLRVSDAVSTWTDLAAMLSVRDLIVMGDGLVERFRPQATMQSLTDAVAACAKQRGCRRLQLALSSIRPGTDSPMETVLRLLLTEAGLPEPVVNAPIRNRFGAIIAHADLAYPAHRVIIEYDGGHHRADERQYNIDIDRLDELMEEGWRVIRVNKNLLARRATLVGKVRTALTEAGGRRPTSLS
jgi:hypothetical protein